MPGRGRPGPRFKPGPLFKRVGPAPTGVACRELGASPIVDVHGHVFSLHDLPSRGFLEKVKHPSLGPVLGNLFAKLRPDRELSWLDALLARTAGLPSPAADDFPDDGAAWFGPLATGEIPLSYALRIPQRTRYRAASSLVRDYPGVSLFTPALVDFDAWIGDNPSPATRIAEQIRTYEKLAKLSMLGQGRADGRSKARLHPFVAFDPRREVARTALSAGVDQYAPVRDELTAPDGPWATRGVQVNNDMSALELTHVSYAAIWTNPSPFIADSG